MTTNSLNDLVSLINNDLLQYEMLASHLCKAEALAEVAMTNGFLDQSEDTQRHYVWALRDLLTDAEQLNQRLLVKWMHHLKHFSDADG
jgi:hypothetical protein